MNSIRMAIVGCGRISDLHQLGYRGRDDARIVAVCDANKSRASQKARDWGVDKVYGDYRQVLEDKSVDAVELLDAPPLALPDDGAGVPGRQACFGPEADGAVGDRGRRDDGGGPPGRGNAARV